MRSESRTRTRDIDLTCEVSLHVGDNVVRAIAMSSTDGLVRGMDVEDTGQPISVPVGAQSLGRIFNLLGEPLDDKGPLAEPEKRYPIHREPPSLEDQATETEQLETGIKVVDLLAPYAKGGKIGLFGGAGVGKTVLIRNSSVTSPPSTAATPCSPAWASAPARATTCGSK